MEPWWQEEDGRRVRRLHIEARSTCGGLTVSQWINPMGTDDHGQVELLGISGEEATQFWTYLDLDAEMTSPRQEGRSVVRGDLGRPWVGELPA